MKAICNKPELELYKHKHLSNIAGNSKGRSEFHSHFSLTKTSYPEEDLFYRPKYWF